MAVNTRERIAYRVDSEMQKIYQASNGIGYEVTRYGADTGNPPLVFFPGYGVARKGYHETLQEVAKRGYEVFLIHALPKKYKMRRNAKEIFIDEAVGAIEVINNNLGLKGKEVIGIGNSTGGARLLQVMEILAQTQDPDSFHIQQAILVSPDGLNDHESELRLYSGFARDTLEVVSQSRLPFLREKMKEDSKRRLKAVREDGIKNILRNPGYYYRLALLLPRINLRHVYQQNKSSTTVISGVDEKTFPPTQDTTVLLPGNHFTVITHAEEFAQAVDQIVRAKGTIQIG